MEQYPDGHYRFFDGEAAWIASVRDGVMGDDTVESLIEEGYELNPVIVMTPEERDAMNADRARLVAQVVDLQAELARAKRWEPVPDGQYKGLVSRQMVIENGGTRIGISFNVYDCNTGNWNPMLHYTTFYHDVRLFRLVEEAADNG